MEDIEQEYRYRPRWGSILLIAVFFASATAFFYWQAVNNEKGINFNDILEIGPKGATRIYWVLAALSGAFIVLDAFAVLHRLVYRQRIVFKDTAITVPTSRWFGGEMDIPYRDIFQMVQIVVSGQQGLQIFHPEGKYTIDGIMLPSDETFEEVRDLLAVKVGGARED